MSHFQKPYVWYAHIFAPLAVSAIDDNDQLVIRELFTYKYSVLQLYVAMIWNRVLATAVLSAVSRTVSAVHV